MRDQASTLRNLIQKHATSSDTPKTAQRKIARIIGLIGGKGGVGTSNLAVNLAVALAQQESRVCLWESNSGRSQLELLCGLNTYWNFTHVLTGAKSLGEVIQKGPGGINLVANAGGLVDLVRSDQRRLKELSTTWQLLDEAYDVLIFDLGTSGQFASNILARMTDDLFLVCTPEPTAITEAYAWFKSFSQTTAGSSSPHLKLIVNRATNKLAQEIIARFGQTTETFLHRPALAGVGISEDVAVSSAVVDRQPFVLSDPTSSASQDVMRVAKRVSTGSMTEQRAPLIERLLQLSSEAQSALLAER